MGPVFSTPPWSTISMVRGSAATRSRAAGLSDSEARTSWPAMVIFTDIESSGRLLVGDVALVVMLLVVGVATAVARLADVSRLTQAAVRATTAAISGTSRAREA